MISLDDLISLGDFIENRTHQSIEKDRFGKIFSDELRELFFHLILSLEKDLHVHISDRKIVKIANLIIAHLLSFVVVLYREMIYQSSST